ncbi:phage tail assembly protein T [Parafrankia soli]|uniref:phage tail assembly protein T n=1 Tax=Parafrankia soli TaxID=2599596 RepID=UPI0009F33D96|nr:DUF4035 domain-containing protein [Parafrankia soli]
MTVGELLARIDSAEISAWMAYEQVTGPLGPARGDYQAAVVSATVANAMAGKKSRRRKLADFLIDWDSRRPQSWEEQLAAVRQINRAMGGRDLTGGTHGDADVSAGQDRRRQRRPRTDPRRDPPDGRQGRVTDIGGG